MPKLSRRQQQQQQLRDVKNSRAMVVASRATEVGEDYTTSASSASDSAEPRGGKQAVEEQRFAAEAWTEEATGSPSTNAPPNQQKHSKVGSSLQEQDVWVLCNKCQKWRRLPPTTNVKKLPRKWFCKMNVSDPARQMCSAPEEDSSNLRESSPAVPSSPRSSLMEARMRQRVKLITRRLKSETRAEVRIARGQPLDNVPSVDYTWARCHNPTCGKWRCIPQFVNADTVGTKRKPFYCSMNYWDETVASCSVPQDALWDMPHNLKRSFQNSEENEFIHPAKRIAIDLFGAVNMPRPVVKTRS